MPARRAGQHHEADHRVDQQLAPGGGAEVGVQLDRYPRAAQQLRKRRGRLGVGQHQPRLGAHPHPAFWLDFRRDPHGSRHDRRRRAEPSHPFDLFDAVLQRAHHRVLVAQPRQPGAGLLVLGVLDGKEHHVNRTVYLGGIGVHGSRQHDRIVVVGPDLDRFARGVPAQQDCVTGGVQIRGDGRADSPGSDECNAATHDRQATGGYAPSTLGSRLVRPFTRSFCAAHTCRRFVADHRCRAEGDPRRLGGASPRPRRRHLHRSARRIRRVAGGVPRG